MESIVAFFEKLVSEFSWRRVALLIAILAVAIVGVWAYEAFTGHFHASRMQFAAEHIAKLADPTLKKNVQGDEQLEKAHNQLKIELVRFVETSNFDVGVPEPIVKAMAAVFPWFLLGLIMFTVTESGQFRVVVGGMLVVAIPFVIVGVLLPTFRNSWINYFGYPFGVVLAIMLIIIMWQRRNPKPA